MFQSLVKNRMFFSFFSQHLMILFMMMIILYQSYIVLGHPSIGLENLPMELKEQIAKRLSLPESHTLKATSKTFNDSLTELGYSLHKTIGNWSRIIQDTSICEKFTSMTPSIKASSDNAEKQKSSNSIKSQLKAIFVTWEVFKDCQFSPKTQPYLRFLYVKLPGKWDDFLSQQQYNNTQVLNETLQQQFIKSEFLSFPHLTALEVLDEERKTLLMQAADKNYMGIFDQVLKLTNEKRVDMDSRKGTTALMFSASQGNVDMSEKLLDKGATVDEFEFDSGFRPVLFACKNGHVDMVKLLIDRGTNLRRNLDHYGNNCLILASRFNSLPLVKYLLSNHFEDCILDRINHYGWSALMVASIYGHVDVVQELLKYHPSIYTKDTSGRNVISLAVKHNQFEVYEVLKFYSKSTWGNVLMSLIGGLFY